MAKTKYDLSGAVKKHIEALKARLEYLRGQEAAAKHQTAEKKPVYQGRIIEVANEIDELEQIVSEG
jgi:hypothetical protein